MADDRKADRAPLTEDRDGPLGEQGWHAGATFFSEGGGRPAHVEGQEGSLSAANGRDRHLRVSETAENVPADSGATDEDVHRPASDADLAPLKEEDGGGKAQSWPGTSFGSIPPPG